MELLDEVGHGLDAGQAASLFAAALAARGIDLDRSGEASIVLVPPGTIHELNLKYREKDAPTDVLSFELDGPYGEVIGEVVICPDCASPEMGVEELVVHGALHLAGMDHGEDFEASEMARVQEKVMEDARG